MKLSNMMLIIHTVIKLKQVEHIRNERKTLAAVSGHPFMMSMIESFSDEQCLYLLVCYLPPKKQISSYKILTSILI